MFFYFDFITWYKLIRLASQEKKARKRLREALIYP